MLHNKIFEQDIFHTICLLCVVHTALLVYSLCNLSLNLNAANASRKSLSWEKDICRCLHQASLQCKGKCKRDMAARFTKCSAKVLLQMLKLHPCKLLYSFDVVCCSMLDNIITTSMRGGCPSHYWLLCSYAHVLTCSCSCSYAHMLICSYAHMIIWSYAYMLIC